jgi:hypothetical protein
MFVPIVWLEVLTCLGGKLQRFWGLCFCAKPVIHHDIPFPSRLRRTSPVALGIDGLVGFVFAQNPAYRITKGGNKKDGLLCRSAEESQGEKNKE